MQNGTKMTESSSSSSVLSSLIAIVYLAFSALLPHEPRSRHNKSRHLRSNHAGMIIRPILHNWRIIGIIVSSLLSI
jgi:hypothetical protein